MEFNLADLFEAVVDAVPDGHTAVVAGDGRLTYRDLDERANRIARHLQAEGIQPGDHVGLYLCNGSEYMEAMLGCYKIRAVPVNVNYRYVEDELHYLFDDADLKAIVHHQQFSDRLCAIRDRLPLLRHYVSVDDGSGADFGRLGAVDYESALNAAKPDRDFPPRSAEDHYILYTGGTTGMPKGVMWRQEDIFFAAMRGGNPLGEPIETPGQIGDMAIMKGMQMGFLVVPPLMHGAAQWATYMALFGGDKVVLYTGHRFDANAIWQLADDEAANTILIVGDAMGRPLAEALDGEDADHNLLTLVAIASGGAILSDGVKKQLRRHFPNVLILDSYGVSETGYHGMRASGAGNDTGGTRFTVDETTAVLDADLRRIEAGSDEIGMLARRGRIPLGYHKDEAKTAKTFVTDPDGVRWALPGDAAQIEADGTIKLLGRGSQAINSGGEKIYPEEVESVLRSHPEVFDVLVVGVPDDRFGERVAAVVAPREGTKPALDDIVEYAQGRLARYKLPRQLSLVDAIVRSPSGKPDYRWARSIAAP